MRGDDGWDPAMTTMRVGIDLFSGVSWEAMRGERDDREVRLVSGVGSSKGKLGGKREKKAGGRSRTSRSRRIRLSEASQCQCAGRKSWDPGRRGQGSGTVQCGSGMAAGREQG